MESKNKQVLPSQIEKRTEVENYLMKASVANNSLGKINIPAPPAINLTISTGHINNKNNDNNNNNDNDDDNHSIKKDEKIKHLNVASDDNDESVNDLGKQEMSNPIENVNLDFTITEDGHHVVQHGSKDAILNYLCYENTEPIFSQTCVIFHTEMISSEVKNKGKKGK